jgi:hypothetical protein
MAGAPGPGRRVEWSVVVRERGALITPIASGRRDRIAEPGCEWLRRACGDRGRCNDDGRTPLARPGSAGRCGTGWRIPDLRLLPRGATFACVPTLLGDQLHGMPAIHAGAFACVPDREPGVLQRVANLQPDVLSRVPRARGHPSGHQRVGCLLMLGDVPIGQALVLFAVAPVKTLVRGQMPARHLRMLIDMAAFNSRVLRSVS